MTDTAPQERTWPRVARAYEATARAATFHVEYQPGQAPRLYHVHFLEDLPRFIEHLRSLADILEEDSAAVADRT